jgi:hypothetical protein
MPDKGIIFSAIDIQYRVLRWIDIIGTVPILSTYPQFLSLKYFKKIPYLTQTFWDGTDKINNKAATSYKFYQVKVGGQHRNKLL